MLIRMISSISRWDGSRSVNRKDAFICGDAISDLRTTNNELSVWKADTQEDIEDAIVALALNRDSVSKLSYFLLEEDELKKIEIDVSDQKPGAVAGLKDCILSKHRDLIELDFWRLGFLTQYMLELVKNPKQCKNLTRKEIKALLEKYKNKNLITVEQMNSKLKEDLKW